MNPQTLYATYRATMTERYGPGPWTSLPAHHRWRVWSKLYAEWRRELAAEGKRLRAAKARAALEEKRRAQAG